MKISVIITLKKDVLDPQGKVIHQALDGIGFNDVNEVNDTELILVIMKMNVILIQLLELFIFFLARLENTIFILG